MAMAMLLKAFLETEGVQYDLVHHGYSSHAMHAAEIAHVSGEQVAKGVLLHDEYGYTLAVLPATHKIQMGKLCKQYHRAFTLADESELPELFNDCEAGAVPPVGKAYDVEVILDDSLNDSPDIYFEAGDHADLVHMSSDDFRHLMGDVQHGIFSRHI